MSVQLLGKRELKRLGSVANDGAGAGYTSFAKGMMAKMGWAEGQGLGKDLQGRSTYVQVKKKDDNAGLGKERAQQNNVNDQWYFNAFDSALAKMGGKKKKKKKSKKSKGEKDNRGEDGSEDGQDCMYDKMFKATGGARMGMRARTSQNGKLARTEGGTGEVGGDKKSPTNLENGDANANGEAHPNAVGKVEEVHVKEEKIGVKLEKAKAEKIADADKGKEEGAVPAAAKKKRKRKDATEGEELAADADRKAERKREKSETKKAKRAEKALKKEAKGGEDGGDDVIEGATVEKARKKKKKRKSGEKK